MLMLRVSCATGLILCICARKNSDLCILLFTVECKVFYTCAGEVHSIYMNNDNCQVHIEFLRLSRGIDSMYYEHLFIFKSYWIFYKFIVSFCILLVPVSVSSIFCLFIILIICIQAITKHTLCSSFWLITCFHLYEKFALCYCQLFATFFISLRNGNAIFSRVRSLVCKLINLDKVCCFACTMFDLRRPRNSLNVPDRPHNFSR